MPEQGEVEAAETVELKAVPMEAEAPIVLPERTTAELVSACLSYYHAVYIHVAFALACSGDQSTNGIPTIGKGGG